MSAIDLYARPTAGFDARVAHAAGVLRADQDPAAAERALAFFASHYQGDVHEARPLFSRDAVGEVAP